MLYNKKMKKLLRKIDRKSLVVAKRYLIDEKRTINGEDYYCINQNFCFPYDEERDLQGEDLTYYEWEGNEIFITICKSKIDLLKKSLEVALQLKRQMKKEFLGIPYDIVLIMDIQRKNSSATIRFYKVRKNNHIIKSEDLEKWRQPILVFNVV